MRDSLSLLARLHAQPAAVDFYAALRQLECAYPQYPRIGRAQRPAEEPVRLGQLPSLAFAPAMLAQLQPPGETGTVPRLLVNGFGLLGPNGPLPLHLSEYIRDRQRQQDDPTLAGFCDLFHHRLLSLFYRAWASAQPAVSLDRPQEDRFADYVASLIGMGQPTLRNRDAVPDLARLHHAGRLAPQMRNPGGLAAILGDFLGMPVRVRPLVGAWVRLPAEGLCRLGGAIAAPALGRDTVIGTQVWSAQHRFRLLIGPLELSQARSLLPGRRRMRQLQAWVRHYAGLALDWDVNLIIQRRQVPRLRLGAEAQLGWTTWLASQPASADDRQLVVRAAPLSSPSAQGL